MHCQLSSSRISTPQPASASSMTSLLLADSPTFNWLDASSEIGRYGSKTFGKPNSSVSLSLSLSKRFAVAGFYVV